MSASPLPTISASATVCSTDATRGSPTYRGNGPLFGGNRIARSLANGALTWIDNPGIGYLPITSAEQPYDEHYFERYQQRDRSPMGAALTRARLDLVRRWWNGPVVDIGIGGGVFVESRQLTWGYDVNPVAVEWLKKRGRYLDPYAAQSFPAATFWDSLEHIEEPSTLLHTLAFRIFVSMPIYRDLAHVKASKHFKPNEHVWYFTQRGLIEFMRAYGWECVEVSDVETVLGREDIGAFAFVRDRRP
jgi:hypothetical protein